jgi:hypothetical protein
MFHRSAGTQADRMTPASAPRSRRCVFGSFCRAAVAAVFGLGFMDVPSAAGPQHHNREKAPCAASCSNPHFKSYFNSYSIRIPARHANNGSLNPAVLPMHSSAGWLAPAQHEPVNAPTVVAIYCNSNCCAHSCDGPTAGRAQLSGPRYQL